MDKPYGKLAEFFYGRAACALAYSLRNRTGRWEAELINGKVYRLINRTARMSLWVALGRSAMRLEDGDSATKLWSAPFLGSFLVWGEVKKVKKACESAVPKKEDEVLCRLALNN